MRAQLAEARAQLEAALDVPGARAAASLRAQLGSARVELGLARADRDKALRGRTVHSADDLGAVVGRLIAPCIGDGGTVDLFLSAGTDGQYSNGMLIRKTAARVAAQPGGDAGACIEILEVRNGPAEGWREDRRLGVRSVTRVLQRLAPTRGNSRFASRWLVDWGLLQMHNAPDDTDNDLLATLRCFDLPPVVLGIRWGELWAGGDAGGQPWSQAFGNANKKVGETAIGLERRKLAATEMRAYQERTEGQLRDLARTWDEAFAVVGS